MTAASMVGQSQQQGPRKVQHIYTTVDALEPFGCAIPTPSLPLCFRLLSACIGLYFLLPLFLHFSICCIYPLWLISFWFRFSRRARVRAVRKLIGFTAF
ncbi:hypothetical protein BR93DRAFT_496495 [Coniochaeta sp. PMI_546]|nr:hypothetical protein BR93DRAFT_496495 [Coniochaeta sp. PMI_546]